MTKCSKCGFELPESAVFCPNCGAQVKRAEEKYSAPSESILNPIRLGLLGAFLSIIILMFAPSVDLYFLPSFVSTLAVVYFSRTRRLRDALIIAMTTYLFTDAVTGGLTLGYLYASKQPIALLYGEYVPTLVDVVMYFISPVTAIIAGYIGWSIAPRRREAGYTYIRDRWLGPAVIYSIRKGLKKFKYALLGSYTS